MKTALLVVALAFGFAGLSGCSSSSTTSAPVAGEAGPKDSGAGVNAKKGVGRLPPVK